MVPELEEVCPDIGQRAGVLAHNVQVLLSQLPDGRAAALKQSWVVQVALWRERGLEAAGTRVPRGTPVLSQTDKDGYPLHRLLA